MLSGYGGLIGWKWLAHRKMQLTLPDELHA
jgi:hypothetical protein